jgi:arginine repressor
MSFNRTQVQDEYITRVIDSLSLQEKNELLFDLLDSDFDSLNDAQLVREMKDYGSLVK